MGCFFILLAAFAPRLALIFLWIGTTLVNRAFDSFLIPLLGLIFLPITTLVYVLVFVPGLGVVGFGWFWVILALLADIGAYGGAAYSGRSRGLY